MSEQPHSAEEALQRSLSRHGILLPDGVAREAAEAVLCYQDEIAGHQMAAPRHQWQDPAFREYARQRQRRELLDNITGQGKVPVALPRESVRFLVSWLNKEVPESSAEWDTVEVALRVGVRNPLVGHEAAVSAPATGSRDA